MLDHPHQDRPSQTLVETVMASVKARIDSRSLAPGGKLASVRDLAARMGVSKSTVVESYERLIAEGIITSRRGSGFYVAGGTRPLSLQALGPKLDRAIDPLWLTRQSADASSDTLRPGSGWLPSSWMPEASLRKGLRHLARDGACDLLCHYDKPLGFAPLRQHLAGRLRERGIGADPDQVMLLDSASQAVDLLLRFFLEPGDTVLVDDPCYFNFHAKLKASRIRAVGVPFGREGPDLAAFSAALATHRPRVYLTNSGLHNPTGVSLSAVTAHHVLKLAEQNDVVIIEDDVFADLETEATPRLAAFDGLNRVIQVGSFSKTISSGMRCGYLAARPAWIEPLVDLKLASSLGNSAGCAALVHHVLTDGSYRRHVESLRAKLSTAMGQTIRRLKGVGLTPFVEPKAGMFVWMRLPDRLDAADVARHALDAGILLAPGNVFSATPGPSAYLRFNVARCGEPRIYDVLRQALAQSTTGASATVP